MCRVLGYRPSLGTFRRFYVNSISNGWLSFSRHSLMSCCLSKKFDSLKNWNDRYFWIDASICPISIPWHTSLSVVKDPLPSYDRVNIELLNLMDHHYMGLLDYVTSADPFKVKTKERTLTEREILLNDETVNMTVAPSTEII
nr:hypothetical protein [Tanacetum cinerariifolium]